MDIKERVVRECASFDGISMKVSRKLAEAVIPLVRADMQREIAEWGEELCPHEGKWGAHGKNACGICFTEKFPLKKLEVSIWWESLKLSTFK